VTVGGTAASVTGTTAPYQFYGAVNLATGTNVVPIVATGTSGVSGTNSYQVVVASGSGRTLSYDLDGEMTNNGAGQNYQWDAANRLVRIWYGTVGSSPNTEFTYNGLGQRVGIVEMDASNVVVIAEQYVWVPGDARPSEERDSTGCKAVLPTGRADQRDELLLHHRSSRECAGDDRHDRDAHGPVRL